MIYVLCKQMIIKGQIAGLQEKLDVYLAANRLTITQYNELVEELGRGA